MRNLSFVAMVGLGLIGCNSADTDGAGGSGGSSNDGGGGGDTTPQALPPPDIGLQLATTAYTLAAGAEEYQCWSFEVPADGALSLVGLEQQIPTTGVHHFGVFTNTLPYEEAGPYECQTMGITWGLVSGGGVGTPGVAFPEGTSMNLEAGQHIILQLHMLNASNEDLEVAPAYVNLIGTNETGLEPVGLLIAGTLDIAVPPHSMNVDATGGCTLDEPMDHVFAVFPHMHQLGKRITAEVEPVAGGDVQMIADQEWNFQDQGLYETEGSAKDGDHVSVTCRYDNPGDDAVEFGLSTKDEMCVNVLYYYPATVQAKYCGLQ